MKRKKEAAIQIGERSYTVFDQRQPLKKEHNGKIVYESNLVRVGEIQAKSSSEALQLAKKKGLAEKPLIWSQETEQMRDIYHQRSHRYDRQQDD